MDRYELDSAMKKKGLTVSRLSRKTGYSKEYIKRVLRGVMPICRHFEEAVRDVLDGGTGQAVICQGKDGDVVRTAP